MNAIDTRIADLLDQGKDRDGVIIELVSGGDYTLNSATNAYAAYARANGLTRAVVSYKDDALAQLTEKYADGGWNPQAVLDEMANLQEDYGVADSTARDYCKAYSDSIGVPLPSVDPRAAMFDWITANLPHMGRDELRKAFLKYAVEDLGRSKSNANEYAKGLDLHFHIMDSQDA